MGKRRHITFSTDFPKVEDFAYRNGVFDDQVLQRMKELASNAGVLKGYGGELACTAADANTIHVATGVAYVRGERAESVDGDSVAITEGDDVYVLIGYQQIADTDQNATRPDTIGGLHTVWYDDGYVISTHAFLPGWVQNHPELLPLAHVSKSGGVITIVDLRVWLTLGIPLAVNAVATAMVADLAVTNAKLGLYAAAEDNLAADTYWVPLSVSPNVNREAGYSLDPSAALNYFNAATGGGLEYKCVGYLHRNGSAGPVRRLSLTFTSQMPGSGTVSVYLIAWRPGAVIFDPANPRFVGASAHIDVSAPDTNYQSLALDVTGVAVDSATENAMAWCLAMRNNSSQMAQLLNVKLIGLR